MRIAIVAILVALLNIPFGYWRTHVKKFSFQWFLAVHIPVPFIVALRIYSDIGFAWYTYIFLVGAFFGGQRIGQFIYKRLSRELTLSACLCKDIMQVCRK